MTRILLTRPRAQSEKLAAILQARGYDIFIEPMLDYRPLAFTPPALKNYQAIILSSAQSAAALPPAEDIPVYTVGNSTAAAARLRGYQKIQVGQGGVEALAATIRHNITAGQKPLLYLRGRDVTQDLQALLPSLTIDEIIVYAMEKTPVFSPAGASLLQQGDIDAALFFSSRTALHFQHLAKENGLLQPLSRIKALCISPAVLKCLRAGDWAELHASATPDQDGILKMLDVICKDL